IQVLDLSNTNISNLPEDFFWGFYSLQILNLSGNQIQNIHPNTFARLQYLTFLDLTKTSLSTEILATSMSSNQSLEELNVENNAILNIDTSRLNYPSLEVLNVRFNSIWRLKSDLLNHVPNLKSLNNIPYFGVVSNDMFQGFPNLTHLSISHNEIRVIEANSFTGLPSLTTLDISNNRLRFIN
ncbi:hypothetical protein CAPTEDRAFT_65222, partial [Capitella teleta]